MVLDTVIIEAEWTKPLESMNVCTHRARVITDSYERTTAITEDVITRKGGDTNNAIVEWCNPLLAYVVVRWM